MKKRERQEDEEEPGVEGEYEKSDREAIVSQQSNNTANWEKKKILIFAVRANMQCMDASEEIFRVFACRKWQIHHIYCFLSHSALNAREKVTGLAHTKQESVMFHTLLHDRDCVVCVFFCFFFTKIKATVAT